MSDPSDYDQMKTGRLTRLHRLSSVCGSSQGNAGCLILVILFLVGRLLHGRGGWPLLIGVFGCLVLFGAIIRGMKNGNRVQIWLSGLLMPVAVVVVWAGAEGAFTHAKHAETANWFLLLQGWFNTKLGIGTALASVMAIARERHGVVPVGWVTGLASAWLVVVAIWWDAEKSGPLDNIRKRGIYFLGIPLAASVFGVTLLGHDMNPRMLNMLRWFGATGLTPGEGFFAAFAIVRVALLPFSVSRSHGAEKERWKERHYSSDFSPRAFWMGALVFTGEAVVLCLLLRAADGAGGIWPFEGGSWILSQLGANGYGMFVSAVIAIVAIDAFVTAGGLWAWTNISERISSKAGWWPDPDDLEIDWQDYWRYSLGLSVLFYVPLLLALAIEVYPSPAFFTVLWSFMWVKVDSTVGSHIIACGIASHQKTPSGAQMGLRIAGIVSALVLLVPSVILIQNRRAKALNQIAEAKRAKDRLCEASEQLHSGPIDDRVSAAQMLGNAGELAGPHAPALVLALVDWNEDVRRTAAAALDNMGPALLRTDAARKTIPALRTAETHTNKKVRTAAAAALARFGLLPSNTPTTLHKSNEDTTTPQRR